MNNVTWSTANNRVIFILSLISITTVSIFSQTVKLPSKIPASRFLANIATNCPHLTELRRCYFFGCLGLVRLPDVYNRLQAATKCVTLGTCSILFGALFYSGFNDVGLKAILCIFFIERLTFQYILYIK